MANTYGTTPNGGSVIAQAGDEYDLTDKSFTGTRKYLTAFTGWASTIPDQGDPHPEKPLLKFKGARVKQLEADPTSCEVTLQYAQILQDDGSSYEPTEPVPPQEVELSGSSIDVDIRQHPKFTADFEQYWDSNLSRFADSAPEYLQGVTSYLVGSYTASVRTHYRAKPAVPSLGVRANPPGYTEAGQWLRLTCALGRSGPFWVRTEIYQFSALPFPPQIYS